MFLLLDLALIGKLHGQLYGEGGTGALFALHGDGTAHQLHISLCDGHT